MGVSGVGNALAQAPIKAEENAVAPSRATVLKKALRSILLPVFMELFYLNYCDTSLFQMATSSNQEAGYLTQAKQWNHQEYKNRFRQG